jgi:outer membrane protein assembly factor BamB
MKKIKIIICTLLIITLVIPITANVENPIAEELQTDIDPYDSKDTWPQFHHDSQNTGYSTSRAPDTNHVLWTKTFDFYPSICNDHITSARVVGNRIYVALVFDWGYYPHPDDHRVICLDSDTGDIIWDFCPGHGWSISDSLIVHDNKVYFGFNEWVQGGSHWGKLFCVDAIDGTHLWNRTTIGWIKSPPVVYKNNLYFGTLGLETGRCRFYCFNATTGVKRFELTDDLGSFVSSSPAVYNDKLYIVDQWGLGRAEQVSCLDALTGERIWSFVTDDVFSYRRPCSPAIYDNKVFLAQTNYNGYRVYCLDANGNGDGTTNIIWDRILDSYVAQAVVSPSVAYGNVYVGSLFAGKGAMFCLNASNGETVWQRGLGESISPRGVSIADGKIFFGTCSYQLPLPYNNVTCLDAFNGDIIWNYQLHTAIWSNPAIANGNVYVTTARVPLDQHMPNPYVICFGPDPLQPYYKPSLK